MIKQGIAISGTAFMLFWLIFVGPAFPSVITIRTGGDASSEAEIVCDKVAVNADDSGEAIFAGGEFRYCNQPGEPQIPWKVMDVLLPPNAELATVVAAMQTSYDMVEGVWNLGPTPTPTTWIDGRKIVDLPTDKNIEDGYDLDIYRADAFWPGVRARLLGAGRIHNWRLAKVAVPLVRYNPTTGQLLSLATADVSVTFSRGKTGVAATRSSKHARSRVKKLAVNFAAAAGEYDGDVIGDMSSSAASEGGVSTAGLESTGYTIITTAAIQGASTKLSSFIAHKESRGFTVKVVTEGATADATHYPTGSTADERADNIRAWLQNNYIADDTLYVLFIGNPHPETFNTNESVPMKMLWPRSDSTEYREAPSDFYFSDLTGNWDLDGDGLYGEGVGDFDAGGVDKYWEVLVGRIPYYGVIADTDAILQKTIDYENSEDVNWRRNVLIAMVPLSEGTFSYDLGEKIKYDLLEPEGIASTRVYRDGYGFTPSPSYHCIRDYPATVWSQDEFGLIVWLTHGWSQGASSVMTSDDAVNLNDSYPGTTWQGSCTNGQPEDSYNLAYAILKNGGIGSMGASRVSWYSSATNMDSVGGMGYQYALRVLARQSCGDSLCDLRQDGYGYWANCCVFNLYGDPSIVVMGPTPAFTITPTDAVYMPGAEGLIASASRTFTLKNNSVSGRTAPSLDWTASHAATWFDLSSYAGTINAQGSATVTVTLNAEAVNANTGTYQDTITFTDTTNGIVEERDVVLEIHSHEIVGHWKLDETSGTTASDSSGKGNDGVLMNMDDADWVAGQFGNALDFDDVNDYLYMESFSLPQESFTVALWFKPVQNLSRTSSRRDLMYWHIGDEPHMSFNRAGDGKIGLYADIDDVEYNDITTTTTSWSAGVWHHITVTFNGSEFKVYLNGALQNSVSHPGMHVVATGLSVGSDEGDKAFGCTIDDVRFYNYALPSTAVQALLYGGRAENPMPADKTTDVRPYTGFRWTPGLAAANHYFYLGTDADAVAAATRQCCEYKAYVSGNQFVGPPLMPDTQYFWRVDGIGSRGVILTTGAVWTFVTGQAGDYNTIYEAEEAVLSGPQVSSDQSGYTGSGYIDYINTSGDYAEYSVFAHYSGGHELAFRYALESGSRPLEIRLDGEVIESSLDFPSTGSWANWDYTADVAVALSAGAHTIRATIADYKGANVDHLRIVETETPPPAGDISGDGEIDIEDFAMFAGHWGQTACSDNPACGGADLDGNRNVNSCDLAVLGEVWLDGK